VVLVGLGAPTLVIEYIAKADTWFDEGTKAEMLSGPWDGEMPKLGLFAGIKNGKPDEEVCSLDEFEIRSKL